MPRFEVLCPAAPPALPADVTLRIDAEHWLGALEAGLRKAGVAQAPTNLLCDVQPDGSIHVSDPAGGRILRVRELGAEPPPARGGEGPGGGPPGPLGGPRAAPPPEEVLAELFVLAGEVARLDRQAGLERLLDLALSRVDAEAGSIFLARAGRRELELAAVRGPRAKELATLRPTVPVGVGIVGFCAREDVCLAISDAEKDPRFHRVISEAIGYPTRSILCAPIARGGQVLGALEVLNKRGGAPFGRPDLAVVSYLAHQAAEHLGRS